VIGAVTLSFLKEGSAPFTLISGIMIGIAIPLLDAFAANYRYLRLAYYSARYRNQNVRVSASYLFRIKIDNTYLLVKGHRWQHYQPVGGVYKVSDGARQILDDVGALDDNLVPIDAVSLHDLRIRILGRNLVSFVRWFETGRSRETSPWREFYEELVKPEIIPSSEFPFVLDNFIRRDIRPIRYSNYAESQELFIADIHELLPTPGQFAALRSLKDSGHTDVIFATEDHIRRLGISPGQNQNIAIAETAAWTL